MTLSELLTAIGNLIFATMLVLNIAALNFTLSLLAMVVLGAINSVPLWSNFLAWLRSIITDIKKLLHIPRIKMNE